MKSHYEVLARQIAEKVLEEHEIISNFSHKKIWMKYIPFKVFPPYWMAYLNRIQTVEKFLPKAVVVEDECVYCHEAGRTADHLLVQC